LTEKVAYERRVREQKMRVEMMQARKENAAYTTLVETGKHLDRIEQRKEKKRRFREFEPRTFKQTKPAGDATKAATSAVLSSLV